jgi:hypothetical protein
VRPAGGGRSGDGMAKRCEEEEVRECVHLYFWPGFGPGLLLFIRNTIKTHIIIYV